jgi:hypothetical protein
MKNSVKLTILSLCLIASANAQEGLLIAGRTEIHTSESTSNSAIATSTSIKSTFEFASASQIASTESITTEMAGNHFLGSEIAKKMYLFNDHYSYKVAIAPGNSATKTVFRKPEIYSSVKKIERFLKKCVKNGDIKSVVAQNEYDKVLNVALNILDENTAKFEERLKSAGENATELLNIYLYEVKLENIN